MSTTDKWLEGFTEALLDRGVAPEAIPSIAKLAALRQLQDNPDFRAGMEKQCAAAGITKEAFWRKALLAALGGMGLWQGGKWLGQGANSLYRKFNDKANLAYQGQQFDDAQVQQMTARNRVAELSEPYLQFRKRVGLPMPGANSGPQGGASYSDWRLPRDRYGMVDPYSLYR
jgi:hypothetical protein